MRFIIGILLLSNESLAKYNLGIIANVPKSTKTVFIAGKNGFQLPHKFAKLIRLILDNSAEEYISLDTEQRTLKLYMGS